MRIILITAASLLASAAWATTYQIDSLAVDPDSPYVTLDISGGPYSGNPISGLMIVGTTSGKSFATFCVDQAGVIYIGADADLPYATGTLTTDGFGNPVSPTQAHEIQALADLGFDLWKQGASDLTDKLPAIQGEIWSIEYPGETIDGGPVIDALMASYGVYAAAHPAMFSLTLNGAPLMGDQNLVIGGVPETPTWLMMLAGFIGLAAVGWRKAVQA